VGPRADVPVSPPHIGETSLRGSISCRPCTLIRLVFPCSFAPTRRAVSLCVQLGTRLQIPSLDFRVMHSHADAQSSSYELAESDSFPVHPDELLKEDDGSEYDEFDPLTSASQPYTDETSPPYRNVIDSEKSTISSRSRWQHWLMPSKFCCMLVLLFFTTLALLVSAGGLWAYKVGVPKDGESEPWYPTPKGGSLQSWAASYRKAADLVSQMTLVEKVNVTTGTSFPYHMHSPLPILIRLGVRHWLVHGYVRW